tara:strand:+ start:14802 stop:15986 length:1185 start_codon:yes stop_codon:yes gene_type:complete
MTDPVHLDSTDDPQAQVLRAELLEIGIGDDSQTHGGELSGQTLEDGTQLRWVHVLSTGQVDDGRGLVIEPQHLASMVEDYGRRMSEGKSKSAGNYHHNGRGPGDVDPETGKATAYVHGLELRADGAQLWMLTEWTPEALGRIEAKEYRYVSAELTFPDASISKAGKFEPGDRATFTGFGMTNRPAIERQVGLFTASPSGPVAETEEPTMLTLLTAMGLTEDTAEAEALQAYEALKADHADQLTTLTAERDEGAATVLTLTAERDLLVTTLEAQKLEALEAAAETAWSAALTEHRALPSHKGLFVEQYLEKSPEDASRVLSPKGTFKSLFAGEGIDGFDSAETGEGMSREKAETMILQAVKPSAAGGEGLTDLEARIKYPIHFRIYEGNPAPSAS